MNEDEIISNIEYIIHLSEEAAKFWDDEKFKIYNTSLKGIYDLYNKKKQEKQKCENTIKKVLEYLDYIDDDILETCGNYDVNGIEIVKILKEGLK